MSVPAIADFRTVLGERADRAHVVLTRHLRQCRACASAGGLIACPADLCPVGRGLDAGWTQAEHAWAPAMGWPSVITAKKEVGA